MAETDARIEPATADDVDPVTDMWVTLAAGQREYGATLRGEANRATVREWVAQSVVTGDLLVARDPEAAAEADAGDPDPVGFVGFSLERGDYDRDAVRGTVSNLFVRPDRRGEGVGAALLDAAERALVEAGAERVALEALADNDRARAFYADRGYGLHRVELTKSLDPQDEDERGGDQESR
ncbi:GNAT family N-acetyltransferase [Halorubrum ezzemoulense]|jgi:ribosomal protein S18 acetylase RimI-like enzyme|uniref:GNAT family N-acetyltransferase n=1 Tax=Halorubrum ezzemoulense TaxID=337243 RepID=A0A256J2Q6_HALEZ|nr:MULTISPECIES: GNAT family N-acetyltransferase [Halorubrum]MDB2264520.1 GNAT family N-acetyltransferase [Halorubrum ezzemoulense]MDB2270591.1 GNAT family N-acetyltransferase [Halorubrum ezzemoulense]MDB2274430.1 GNAT family N-acetyltransferase [Halorubrum ezzemoulense]MDB9280575.1 GNAT family N-acetyltransferase [Halorubrum ezzemoulense]MDB9284246.1 GNAT family N-acetyltransferase [Halorubrum ezzemoulense]